MIGHRYKSQATNLGEQQKPHSFVFCKSVFRGMYETEMILGESRRWYTDLALYNLDSHGEKFILSSILLALKDKVSIGCQSVLSTSLTLTPISFGNRYKRPRGGKGT